MNTDMTYVDVKVKREQLTKWDGDVPDIYRGVDVDPDNPPPEVREIQVAIDGGPFQTVYQRDS